MNVERILDEAFLDLPRLLRSHAEAGGAWESVFLGLGVEPSGWKSWQPGDRLRDINPRSFVRAQALGSRRELLSREYTGQREMRVTFILDISRSLLCSGGVTSLNALPAKRGVEYFAALTLGAASFWGISIRFVAQDGDQLIVLPQRQGIGHVQSILGRVDALAITEAQPTGIPVPLLREQLYLGSRSLVFFVSDFADEKSHKEVAAAFHEAHRHHKTDTIPVFIDTFWIWQKIQGVYEFLAQNSLSGQPFTVVTDVPGKREIELQHRAKTAALTSAFRHFGIPWIHIEEPDIRKIKEETTRCFVEKRRMH